MNEINNKICTCYSRGLTLLEVVIYLALVSVFLSVAVPTSLNIVAGTQSQQLRLQNDQQFITMIHSIEALVRTDQGSPVTDVSTLLVQYSNLISSSSVSTQLDSQTGLHLLLVSFFYDNQIYSYVYTY